MAVDHLDNLNYTFTLSPAPVQAVGFGKVLLIVPLATNSLNGDTTRTYVEIAEAQADFAAGYISQATLDQVSVGFLQFGTPEGIKVGAVDLVGAETWGAAFQRILDADGDFYFAVISSRTAADIVSIATQVEAEGTRQFMFQTSDAGWLTDGIPAGFATLANFERASYIFHDEDTEYHDMAWVADRLGGDPDVGSPDWKANLRGVSGLTTPLTSTQKGFLEDTNNGNVALGFGPTTQLFVDPGQNISGRDIYEVQTQDWYRVRTQERFTALILDYTARYRKLVVGQTGQAAVAAALNVQLELGSNMESPHFIKGQTRVTFSPSDLDFTNQRMAFKVEGQLARSARGLDFNIFFQQDALAEAA